jgi:hypothetical protein
MGKTCSTKKGNAHRILAGKPVGKKETTGKTKT